MNRRQVLSAAGGVLVVAAAVAVGGSIATRPKPKPPPPPPPDGSIATETVTVRMPDGPESQAPTWSAAGDVVVVEVAHAFGAIKLDAVDIASDGTATVNVVAPLGTPSEQTQELSEQANGASSMQRLRLMGHPTWLSDGRLLFEGTVEKGAVSRLYVTKLGNDTAEPLLLQSVLPGELRDGAGDHAGKRVVFVNRRLDRTDLAMLDLKTKKPKPFAPAEGIEGDPVWTADDGWVVYSRTVGGDADIVRTDTTWKGKTEPVVAGPGQQIRPLLLGDAVAYFDSPDGNTWNVAILDAPGAAPRTLATNVKLPPEGPPAISADGAWLATVPVGADRVYVTHVDGSSGPWMFKGDFAAPTDVAISSVDGRVRLAFVGGPPSDRQLRLADVTDALSKPPPAIPAPPPPPVAAAPTAPAGAPAAPVDATAAGSVAAPAMATPTPAPATTDAPATTAPGATPPGTTPPAPATTPAPAAAAPAPATTAPTTAPAAGTSGAATPAPAEAATTAPAPAPKPEPAPAEPEPAPSAPVILTPAPAPASGVIIIPQK